nr:phosphoribosylamine--glycine ligase [Bacillus infantis]
MVNVLVIGRGGREHSICRKMSESPSVDKVYAAPGNHGMADCAALVPIDEMNFPELAAFAKENEIGLTVIGPEAPLQAGLADFLGSLGMKVFGPKKEAAVIEGSKSFAKELMEKYDIPTAEYRAFTDYEKARAYLDAKGAPIVIKADGLAAGKGVTVAMTLDEAHQALEEMMVGARFGEASAKVVIEEFLEGEEFSLMAFVNGSTVVPLDIAQDHKRAYDGDQGPNTGGMGAYSPVPHIGEDVVQEAVRTILEPAAKAMELEGRSFCGVLYAGLIQTECGPKVIEFNARFGDPETQAVLPRMQSDLAESMLAVIDGGKPEIEWDSNFVLGVVAASTGYPGSYGKGAVLKGLSEMDPSLFVFHAGTKQNEDGEFITDGGRVLLAGARAKSLSEAQEKVYAGLEKLECEGVFYRKDIGGRAIARLSSQTSL